MTSGPEGRRGSPAGPPARPGLLAVAVAVALLVSGCATGDVDVDAGATPRRDLAARPSDLSATSASATASSGTATRTPAPGSAAPTTGTATGTAAPRISDVPASPLPAPPGEGPYRVVGVLEDPAADSGDGPGYADLRRVVLEDDGTRLRATVTVAGALPARLAGAEAQGVGVDLYPAAGRFESDYQLFADGGPDGWFAYLSTPQGFVRYPGGFALGGSTLVFTVPWSSVGARRSGQLKAFADWTQGGTGTGGLLSANRTGNDRAPRTGTAGYDRD